jgi:acyl carrier protein
MDRPHIAEFVLSTLAQAAGTERTRLDEETDLSGLGVDSMVLTTIAMHVESFFECELSEFEMQRLFEASSAGDLVTFFVERLDIIPKTAGSVPAGGA